METINLIHIWKTQGSHPEKTLKLNHQLIRELINQKAERSLQKLEGMKTGGIIGFAAYLVLLAWLLGSAVSHYSSAYNYFIFSASAIFIINAKGLYDYIKHLIWIKQFRYNGSIAEVQDRLNRLRLSIFRHSRTMVIQLPFYTTWMLSDRWFPQNVGIGYYVFQAILTSSFTYAAFWLYKNQTIENAHKKWMKLLIAGSGGKAVTQALDLYKEIEEFKSDSTS